MQEILEEVHGIEDENDAEDMLKHPYIHYNIA